VISRVIIAFHDHGRDALSQQIHCGRGASRPAAEDYDRMSFRRHKLARRSGTRTGTPAALMRMLFFCNFGQGVLPSLSTGQPELEGLRDRKRNHPAFARIETRVNVLRQTTLKPILAP
jgi:hypothetical protein